MGRLFLGCFILPFLFIPHFSRQVLPFIRYIFSLTDNFLIEIQDMIRIDGRWSSWIDPFEDSCTRITPKGQKHIENLFRKCFKIISVIIYSFQGMRSVRSVEEAQKSRLGHAQIQFLKYNKTRSQ